MTRKDYVLIAEMIRNTRYNSIRSTNPDYQLALDNLAHALLNGLKQDNPNFDGSRFLSACEYGKLPRESEVA